MSLPAIDQAILAITRGPAGPKVGAFFDFDGTLIDGYSVLDYFLDRMSKGALSLGEITELARQLMRPQRSEDEFSELVGKGVLAWAGRSEEDLNALWLRLFHERVADYQFPEAWRLVQAHKRMGHTVAIASSATRYQITPLAQEWAIEHVMCTEAMIRNQRLTGGVVGRPAWGQGKAEVVVAFARRTGVSLGKSYGYANGDEDIPFLRKVGKPHAVNPKPQLARAARETNWPVLAFEPRRLPTLESLARSVVTYAAMLGSFAAGLAFARAGGDERRAADLGTCVASDLSLLAAGIKVEVVGKENLWAKRPAIFIFNHQSKLDLLLMGHLVRRQFTGVAKKELADLPGIGAFMRMADVAFVDRGKHQEASAALLPAMDKLRNGLSLCIAPEGTRSYSPRIGVFKKGAFHLAMQAGVPVVPVVIRNAGERMTRNSMAVRAGRVQVAVLKPISVRRWTEATLDRHVAAVRELYIQTLDNWPGATP